MRELYDYAVAAFEPLLQKRTTQSSIGFARLLQREPQERRQPAPRRERRREGLVLPAVQEQVRGVCRAVGSGCRGADAAATTRTGASIPINNDPDWSGFEGFIASREPARDPLLDGRARKPQRSSDQRTLNRGIEHSRGQHGGGNRKEDRAREAEAAQGDYRRDHRNDDDDAAAAAAAAAGRGRARPHPWRRLATRRVFERAREPLPAGEARFFLGPALLRLGEVEPVAAETADPGVGFHLLGAVRTGLLSQLPAQRAS